MSTRPSRRGLGVELIALVGAIALSLWADRDSNWDLPLFAVLLTSSVVGDLTALDAPARSGKISSSFLAIFVATVLLGPTPAALISVVTILASWLRSRYSGHYLLNNLVAYAWFPLLSGIAFDATLRATGTAKDEGSFYLLVFALFAVALLLNYAITLGSLSYLNRTGLRGQLTQTL